MRPVLYLSLNKLRAYAACQRRFQLRYVHKLPWPGAPTREVADQSLLLGQRFHQLMQRYFLGLSVADEANSDPRLRSWWQWFTTSGPDMLPGRRYPELTMTVPIEGHFLTGRFDLLILADEAIQIFDWKTGDHPRSRAELGPDLQTRLYLALAAEGTASLGCRLAPEQIRLTYWYMGDPATAVTIAYSTPDHDKNWALLRELMIDIDRQLRAGKPFPLTESLAECGHCAYQHFCDRRVDALDLSEWDVDEIPLGLEPGIP